jgi:hypothetical protein
MAFALPKLPLPAVPVPAAAAAAAFSSAPQWALADYYGEIDGASAGGAIDLSSSASSTVASSAASSAAVDTLPPIWVPLVFAALILIGVGLQTQSLGDVVEAEARLGGINSASKAKRSTRDRSMFIRKRPSDEGPTE